MRTDIRENVQVHTGDSTEVPQMESGHPGGVRQDISQALTAIDTETRDKQQKKRQKSKKRRIVKIVGIVVGALVALGLGFVVYKAWQVGSRVFQGNLSGLFQQHQLKMDEHGRSNVLILGSTDDMEGRDGATLTDSMMVVSVDQSKKDAYMFSVPRDLYVKYDRACFTGYEGKINAYFTCADQADTKEAELARMDATKKLVGDIFGMDIQYAVHVNTVVIRDGVNAVGGITVNVESDDERGVLDSIFDDMCRNSPQQCPRGHFMDFPNGPNEMNGDQAMAFSQARGMGARTYGLSGSNFSREQNQQLVLMALKDKATSTGTLTDITRVMGLMDAMGNNLRTDVDAKEIQTIMKLAAEIEQGDIHRLSFYEEDNRLMTTGNIAGQSIVQPTAGLYNYAALQSFIKKTVYATPLSKEGANIVVLNGGGVQGSAQEQADALEALGLTVGLAGNAPSEGQAHYTVYQLAQEGNMPLTRAKLEELYGVSVRSGGPDFQVAAAADFIVVIGSSLQ